MSKSVVVCLLTIGCLLSASSLNAAPVHDWSHCYGGPGINTAFDVAVDGNGNVAIAGSFAGTMNLGGGALTSAGGQDIFLAMYTANGVHLWSQRFGGTGNDIGRAVAFDGAGNVILTGTFRGPVGFGGSVLIGRGLQDIVVAKYNAAGFHQWSQWYGSAAGDEGQDVTVDASNNVIVTGHYGGVINFGGGPDTPTFGSLDFFVLKLDDDGVYQWSKGIGGPNPDQGLGVAVDASNNVLLTGIFNNTVNFGGGSLVSAGSSDVFVVKYDASGAHQWSTRLGGPAADRGEGIGVDGAGSAVVTGSYNGALLAKYDMNGVQQWMQNFAGTDMVQGLDLAVSGAGTIAITGNLRGTTDFGGGPLASAGDDDIFFALYEVTGAHRWSQRFGNTGDDWGHALAVEPSGNLLAAGIFSMSVDFGGGPLMSAGLNDVYVVKFDDHVADTTPPMITCPGDVQVEQAAPDGTPATQATIAAFLAGATASDDEDPAPAITHDAPAVFPAGMTTVTFRATDAAGNYDECSALVTVFDTTPPQIACPANAVVEQSSPAGTPASNATITAFLTGVSASDAADPAPAITDNAPSVFPAGVTVVTFRATDAVGNHSECAATVNVVDTTPPQIDCPSNVQVERTAPDGTPATHEVIAAFLAGVSASDAADASLTLTNNAPEMFPLGTTTVTFHAMDDAGNSAECSAQVSVFDTTPPQIKVVLDKDVLWPPDHKFVTVCAEVTVEDAGDGEPTYWLDSIVSNEPEDKRGSGQTAPDYRGAEFGTPDLCFDLRAERAGNGGDRVYEIIYAAKDASGNTVYGSALVTVPHDKSAELTSARPNPFNPQTTLDYSLSVGDHVLIAIFDARGSLVRRLVDQQMPAGEHRVTWNGLDNGGLPVGSGIYFVKLAAGSETDSRKIVLLK